VRHTCAARSCQQRHCLSAPTPPCTPRHATPHAHRAPKLGAARGALGGLGDQRDGLGRRGGLGGGRERGGFRSGGAFGGGLLAGGGLPDRFQRARGFRQTANPNMQALGSIPARRREL
jgi:hypothetical protein